MTTIVAPIDKYIVIRLEVENISLIETILKFETNSTKTDHDLLWISSHVR